MEAGVGIEPAYTELQSAGFSFSINLLRHIFRNHFTFLTLFFQQVAPSSTTVFSEVESAKNTHGWYVSQEVPHHPSLPLLCDIDADYVASKLGL